MHLGKCSKRQAFGTAQTPNERDSHMPHCLGTGKEEGKGKKEGETIKLYCQYHTTMLLPGSQKTLAADNLTRRGGKKEEEELGAMNNQ